MTAISGQKWLGLFPKSDPLGSLARTLLASSQWASTTCYLTWRVWATPSKRSVFRLAPSMPRTAGIGSGFWPTPASTDGPHGGLVTPRKAREGGNLVEAVSARTMWPTPTSRDHKDTGDCANVKVNGLLGRAVEPSLSGGALSPDWVEWLMNFPLGWTEVPGFDGPKSPTSRASKKARRTASSGSEP